MTFSPQCQSGYHVLCRAYRTGICVCRCHESQDSIALSLVRAASRSHNVSMPNTTAKTPIRGNILAERYETTTVEYLRGFYLHGRPGTGYGFECDEHGNIILPESARQDLSHPVFASILDAMTNPAYYDAGVERREHTYRHGLLILCDCGAEVQLDGYGHDTDCDSCGASYNSGGQRLAPRSQWGLETGETAMDYDLGFAGHEDRDEVYHGLGDFDGGEY